MIQPLAVYAASWTRPLADSGGNHWSNDIYDRLANRLGQPEDDQKALDVRRFVWVRPADELPSLLEAHVFDERVLNRLR